MRESNGVFQRAQKTATVRPVPSRFYRLPLDQIAYVRAVIEGYDGLATLRAQNANRGEVEWIIGEGLEEEAAVLAERLGREAGLIEIARPPDWEPFE